MTGKEVLNAGIADEQFARVPESQQKKLNKYIADYDKAVLEKKEEDIKSIFEEITDMATTCLVDLEMADEKAQKEAKEAQEKADAEAKEAEKKEKERKGGFFGWFQKD
jgi:cell division septum initiation protein DivIVA